MQEKGDELNRPEDKTSIVRRLFLYLLMIAFFLCVVIVYFQNLYYSTRENIVSNGRINAIESTNQLDKNLLSGLNVLKLAGYTLDNMIKDDYAKEDILEYLTNETVAVGDSLVSDTTGIYGYIKGDFMDGSGWVPEGDYDPKGRPWYTGAIEEKGDIVIVDPYIDLDTGSVTISIVKSLCDGESVVGIDLLMDGFQETLEEHVKGGRSCSEFLINERGKVIAHSDRTKIGIDIDDSPDPFFSDMSDWLEKNDSGFFNIRENGRDYIVYVLPLDYSWSCVSVTDATGDFRKLYVSLIITIISAIIILGIFLFLVNRMEIKNREALESNIITEKAMAANEAKSAFLSNMSHEIRTPINAVLGMNEMILRECEDEDILLYAENVRTAGNTLLGLINDVLDFSKIEAGKLTINPAEYDLSSLVNDLVNMISVRAEEKGLAVITEFDPEIPKLLYGDEIRIKQVITNILTNAVKYTEKGGVTFRIRYEKPKDDADSIVLRVSVIDTGIGIKTQDMHKLFSKFERIDEKRNRNIEGTGLGMSITKNLLILMGSELQVGSVYGQGSVFSFALKQKVIKWEPLGDYKSAFDKRMAERKKYREKLTAPDASVLVVDDNAMNLMVFKSLLKKTQIKVETASSGDEGISYSLDRKYDIIFLDHMMPKKDGIQTLHEMEAEEKSPNKDTPVICLTANAISGAKEEYIKEGFNDYLSKPVDAVKLEEMLIRYLPEEKVVIKEEAEKEEKKNDLDKIPASVRECSVIDEREGLSNSGTLESYLSLLKIFYDSIDEKADELYILYNSREIKDFTVKVHALKSSAKLIGAVILGEEAQRLEDAGKSDDTTYIDRHFASFLEDYLRFKKILSPEFGEHEGYDDRQEADMEMMRSVYSEIASAAAAMDCDTLEGIFEEMKAYRIPEAEADFYGKLKAAAGDFDYDAVTSLLTEK